MIVCDVAVIGSGPAGGAVAIHCQHAGLDTAIFTLPGHRARREIPETLPTTARPLLHALGFQEGLSRLGLRPQYAIASAWGTDSITTRHSICNASGPGWFVDRSAFDAEILRQAVSGRVPVIEGRILSASQKNQNWTLQFQVPQNPEPLRVKAAVVVDATGRSSAFARCIGIRRLAFDAFISLSAPAVPCGNWAGEVLVESAPDGWWFSALAPSGELSVSWFTEGRLLRPDDRSLVSFERRLRKTVHTAARVSTLLPQKVESRLARTDRLTMTASEGWIAVGDAATACDPLGSQGLVKALQSSALACELIVSNRTYDPVSLRTYNEIQIDYLERFLRERHFFYAMERRWPEAPFWRRFEHRDSASVA